MGVEVVRATLQSTKLQNVVNSNSPSYNTFTSHSNQELGTGFGESKRSEVREVEFDRESNPDAVFELFYNTKEELLKIGIDFDSKPVYITPQAFPGKYCEPPKR